MPYSPMELAEVFIKTGELSDALDALNQQLATVPDDNEARRLRIKLYLSLQTPEDLDLALTDFDALSAKNAEDYLYLSILQEKRHELSAALVAAQSAHDLSPHDERLLERVLHLLVTQGDYQTALLLVEKQPQTWRWRQWAGDLYKALGEHQAALTAYQQAYDRLTQFEGQMRADYLAAFQAQLLLALAAMHRALGQLEQARDCYYAAQTRIPHDPSISFNLAVLAALEGHEAEAVEQARHAIEQASRRLREEMQTSLAEESYALQTLLHPLFA